MTTKNILKICIFTIFIGVMMESCNLISKGAETYEPFSITPTINLPQATNLTSDTLPSKSSPCQADKWIVAPIFMDRWSAGNGFDLVLIKLAVTNESDLWGYVQVSSRLLIITTEEGFSYETYSSMTNLPSGGQFWPTGGLSTQILPPGFTTLGDARYGGMSSGEVEEYAFVFKIASTQQELTLNVQNPSVICIPSDNSGQIITDEIPIKSYSLDNLYSPNFPSPDNYPDIIDLQMELPYGTVRYLDSFKKDGNLLLHLTFTNRSNGYDSSGCFSIYLVSDDGIFRQYGVSTSAGPGLTTDIEDISFRDSNINNAFMVFEYYPVWCGDRHGESKGVYQVYSFNLK